jgi:cobalt-precorrin-5B (C1)-methyltransferase
MPCSNWQWKNSGWPEPAIFELCHHATMKKPLRNGYTTGACSAAAAKAATEALLLGFCPKQVEIPFPEGARHSFAVFSCVIDGESASATIIKDAGDDPDVTNRAKISATVRRVTEIANKPDDHDCVALDTIVLCRGEGVGIVSKPGLAVEVGEPAINPVPRKMIAAAVAELTDTPLEVRISVAEGESLAQKTLNHRLGIVGGLSILGTTGVVRPISADAWTATISASMDVARAAGLDDIVLSTGRTSEKGAQSIVKLPVEGFAMMGDYLEFSLLEAAKKGFSTVHLSAMWAKLVKAALEIPQTHVRNGPLEIAQAANLLEQLGAGAALQAKLRDANTAREMLSHITNMGEQPLIAKVCKKAKEYAEKTSKCRVNIYLIDHRAELIERV